ncbi:MAG: calcium/sodium antiporter [Pseudomonadota bacterium]
MSILIALLQLAAGFVLLMWSADRLVSGASALARNFGISTMVVGLVIVGFGTSAPEMVVSALAALEGNPSLAIGNALGSNIANVGLILGVTGLIFPMVVDRSSRRREFPILGLATIGTAILMINGSLSRIDGLILISGLGLFLFIMIYRALHRIKPDPSTVALLAEIPDTMSNRAAIIWTLVGLIILPLSAHILVDGAVTMATIMDVSEAVVGLTIVALGTSLPELAAAIASAVKKEDDLCIGNILGSNLFNLMGVLGIAALIHPMQIESMLIWRDLPVMAAIFAVLALMAYTSGRVTRSGAAFLLLCYFVYQIVVIYAALV